MSMNKYLGMCTLIAKKFPKIGWVGIKNRDRSSPTETELLRDQLDDIQRVTLMDEHTRWSEGMNSQGISIISSSLDPEIHSKISFSKNGPFIRDALAEPTISRAIESLKGRATGHIMIFDKNDLYILEGTDGGNEQVVRKIISDSVARTNHGIWIPKAGYQRDSNNFILQLRRISSEARLAIANYITYKAASPAEMMLLMAKSWTNNPQINTMRHATKNISTRTTEQLMLEPGEKSIIVRNTDGVLEFDQQSANPRGSKVIVGIID